MDMKCIKIHKKQNIIFMDYAFYFLQKHSITNLNPIFL